MAPILPDFLKITDHNDWPLNSSKGTTQTVNKTWGNKDSKFPFNLTTDKNWRHLYSDSTLCLDKKHPRHFRLSLEKKLSDFDNFWYQYSGHNLPSNDHSVSHLTHCPILHYLGKAD